MSRLRVIGGSGPRAISPAVAEASAELAASLARVEAPPPDLSRLIRPTMSKTDLLFACSYPWFRRVVPEAVGERTRFGSAFHEGAEAKLRGRKFNAEASAKQWGVDAEELTDRLAKTLPTLVKWLRGDNLWGLDFTRGRMETEKTAALNLVDSTAPTRILSGGPGDAHDYPEALPEEFPGTADLIASETVRKLKVGKGPHPSGNLRALLILDHKSGWSVAPDWAPKTPAENGQLRSLATAFADLYSPDLVIVAFFHAPANGLPIVMADELTANDLRGHRRELEKAWRRIGNGWLHPGDWCGYCPNWSGCPTNSTTLVELKRAGGPLTSERVGAIHQAKAEFERCAERLGAEIRAWVEAHGPGIRPDGSTVELVEREVERISKAGILRALGPEKGEAMLEQLRSLGALASQTEMQLRAVKPR